MLPDSFPSRASRLHATVYRLGLNLWPCVRRTGGRVTELAPDFSRLVVRLKLDWRTRNVVGTIFGGAMMASTDPMLMLMLQQRLGKTFVVWDKSVAVRFKRPAKRTLFAEFLLSDDTLAEVRRTVAERGEADFTWTICFRDADGVVHSEFDKTLYVADKAFYKAKVAAREARVAVVQAA